MEYLDKVLGVKVTYDDVEFKHLPNFSHKILPTDGVYEWTEDDFSLS